MATRCIPIPSKKTNNQATIFIGNKISKLAETAAKYNWPSEPIQKDIYHPRLTFQFDEEELNKDEYN